MGLKKTTVHGLLATILVCIGVWSRPAYPQAQGTKAVIGSSGATPSTVWIDASAWWLPGVSQPDLCVIINTIITGLISASNTTGVVIDARGLYHNVVGGTQNLACTGSPFPSSLPGFAMTVLLPAGVILMNTTWTLPNNTRLVGESPGTDLVAQSSFAGSYMIEMGGSGVCPTVSGTVVCTSVGIEHLYLSDASTPTGVGGIYNQYSTNSSYINDVNLHNFNNIGLRIAAADSGPYSGIAFSSYKDDSVGTPVCILIEAQTLGIHGVTCVGNPVIGNVSSPNAAAAIYVKAGNNSIEDVHIEDFWDGIQIENPATGTIGNILVSNVTGSKSGMNFCTGTDNQTCLVKNVVHICGPTTPSRGSCATTTAMQDITVLNATDSSYDLPDVIATIQDDTTGTSIVRCGSSACEMPLTTAIYVLGESYAGGYPRFATNPSNPGTNYDTTSTFVPTWSVGSLGTSTITGQSCLTPGAIYSNTSGGITKSVFVCTYSGTSFQWEPIA